MSRAFLIIWSIVALLLMGFEFYAEQELRRASRKDKLKISNYKRCGLWNIILCIFYMATIIYFSIVDFHNSASIIILCVFLEIKSIVYAVMYYTKKIYYKTSDTTTDITDTTEN